MKQNLFLNRLRRDFHAHFTGKRNDKAVELAKKIISIHKSLGSDNTKIFADDIFNIALLYDKIGDYENSIKLYGESARVLAEGGYTGTEQVYRLENMAIAKCRLSQYDSAIALFAQAGAKLTDAGKTMSIEYVRNLYNLGNAYLEIGRSDQAAELFLAAEKHMPKGYREGAFDLIDIRCARGYALEAMEDFEGAIASLSKALYSMRKFMPDDMLEISKNTYYLANTCLKAKKFDLAIDYFKQTIQLTRKLEEGKDAYYPRCLAGIADAYSCMDQDRQALEYRLEALEQIRRRVGGSHIYYANCLRGAALSYRQLEEYAEAESYIRQSLDIRRRLLGKNNTDVLRDMISLMDIYSSTQDTEKAILLLTEALSVLDNDYPQSEHSAFIAQLAKIYMSLGDINDLNEMFGQFEL